MRIEGGAVIAVLSFDTTAVNDEFFYYFGKFFASRYENSNRNRQSNQDKNNCLRPPSCKNQKTRNGFGKKRRSCCAKMSGQLVEFLFCCRNRFRLLQRAEVYKQRDECTNAVVSFRNPDSLYFLTSFSNSLLIHEIGGGKNINILKYCTIVAVPTFDDVMDRLLRISAINTTQVQFVSSGLFWQGRDINVWTADTFDLKKIVLSLFMSVKMFKSNQPKVKLILLNNTSHVVRSMTRVLRYIFKLSLQIIKRIQEFGIQISSGQADATPVCVTGPNICNLLHYILNFK